MDKACDLEAAEASEKSHSQQVDDSVPAANGLLPETLNQVRTQEYAGDSEPSVHKLLNHLHEGTSQGSAVKAKRSVSSCFGHETPAVLDPDGPNRSEILSGECLARERLLNEHFNNSLPQRSQYTVSRTEMADGRAGRTLGPSGQEHAFGSGPVQDSGSAVDECPICTESYHSQGGRSVALLNCGHSMCQLCLATMLRRVADCSRVQCPLCRQKTPLIQWDIYRLQEDTAVCVTPPDLSTPMLGGSEPQAEPPGPGLCSTLAQRLLLRAETARVCGCFGHPRWLMQLIRRLQHCNHCFCCYITMLVIMYLTELTFLLLVFMPVVVLVLLFTLGS